MATRGLGSFSGAAAAAILLWCHCFVLHALFVTANSIPHQHLSSETPTGQVAFRRDPPAIGGKVDIFLDLACPDSAFAWKTIKDMVWEFEFRTRFAFHVLPMPSNQMALDTAKAVQCVSMFSSDSDEVVLFIDAMFAYQPLIQEDVDDDVARQGFRGILEKWALAAGSITGDQFHSSMENPEFDDLVKHEARIAASLEVFATPAVVLNSDCMVHLVGAHRLNNFRLFFASWVEPFPPHDSDGASMSSIS